MDITLALITGLASAVVYSFIQGIYSYFRWIRTRRFFLSELQSAVSYIDYYLITILEINPIYDTDDEIDHLMDQEELISEIESIVIRSQQFQRREQALQYTKGKIEGTRKEGLCIPIFNSKDFHATDKLNHEINLFLSSYSWLKDETQDSETSKMLKSKLIKILNVAKEKLFTNNFLDNVNNWYRRKVFSLKKNTLKRPPSPTEENLPF